MKKIIGIPGYLTETSFGVGKSYLQFAQTFGEPVIIMPHEEFRKVDLLLLTGGLDVNPAVYGEVPSFYTSNSDVFKQFFFDKRLQTYIDNKVPIFGICLGFQQLNVKFGGTLEQNLLWHPQSPDRWEKGHKVKFGGGPAKEVNSHHHQGVLTTGVADCFDVLAVEDTNDDVKVVEAIKHKDLPIAGVQWHPEEWYDNFSIALLKSLMK